MGALISTGTTLLILGLCGWGIWRAAKQPLWAEAIRRLRRNGLAMAALACITLYLGIAVLDSVALGDIPGVGMVVIDGVVRCHRSRNTPPATEVPVIVAGGH